MHIAAIQHDIIWEDRTSNLARLTAPIDVAARGGSRLVVLAEMFPTGFSMNTAVVAEPFDGPTTAFLMAQARDHDCWIGGTFACITDEHELPTNRFVVAAPDGELHYYDKIHPFTYANEHTVYRPGQRTVTVTIDEVRCTLFICYDLRFATEFWETALRTDLYVVPANWPNTRAQHWQALLTARAIENQANVVGVNRVGTAATLRYDGHSMIVDPLGRSLASAAHGETVLFAEINADVVAETRTQFPFLADRLP